MNKKLLALKPESCSDHEWEELVEAFRHRVPDDHLPLTFTIDFHGLGYPRTEGIFPILVIRKLLETGRRTTNDLYRWQFSKNFAETPDSLPAIPFRTLPAHQLITAGGTIRSTKKRLAMPSARWNEVRHVFLAFGLASDDLAQHSKVLVYHPPEETDLAKQLYSELEDRYRPLTVEQATVLSVCVGNDKASKQLEEISEICVMPESEVVEILDNLVELNLVSRTEDVISTELSFKELETYSIEEIIRSYASTETPGQILVEVHEALSRLGGPKIATRLLDLANPNPEIRILAQAWLVSNAEEITEVWNKVENRDALAERFATVAPRLKASQTGLKEQGVPRPLITLHTSVRSRLKSH